MADEQTPLETTTTPPDSGAETRIRDLSSKVRLTAEERDEAVRLNTESTAKLATAEKERDFYSGFADVVSKYPAAKDFKDNILEKVKAGYSVEDATAAVLVRENKYVAPRGESANPAGGSATVTPTTGGTKQFNEMTREEKRAKLVEAEQRGDISMG